MAAFVIRPSGTEPVIRVMGEGDDADLVQKIVDDIVAAVTRVRSLSVPPGIRQHRVIS